MPSDTAAAPATCGRYLFRNATDDCSFEDPAKRPPSKLTVGGVILAPAPSDTALPTRWNPARSSESLPEPTVVDAPTLSFEVSDCATTDTLPTGAPIVPMLAPSWATALLLKSPMAIAAPTLPPLSESDVAEEVNALSFWARTSSALPVPVTLIIAPDAISAEELMLASP